MSTLRTMQAPSRRTAPLCPGDQVSVFMRGTLGSRRFMRLNSGSSLYVPEGEALIPGDVTVTMRQALRSAVQFHDCGTAPDCAAWTDQFEALLFEIDQPVS